MEEACDLLASDGADGTSILTLRLRRRPERQLDVLCGDVIRSIAGPDARLDYVSGRKGSWIEVWQIAPAALATLQLVLMAVNGVLKEMRKAVEEAGKLRKAISRGRSGRRGRPVEGAPLPAIASAGHDGMGGRLIEVRRRASLLTDEALRSVDSALARVADRGAAAPRRRRPAGLPPTRGRRRHGGVGVPGRPTASRKSASLLSAPRPASSSLRRFTLNDRP